jgi:flavin-dependent dehydrogenase
MDFDAIVVGAGPGGCTVAWGLAKAGFNVGLFDKMPADDLGLKTVIEVEKRIFPLVNIPDPPPEEIAYASSRFRAFTRSGSQAFILNEEPCHAVRLDHLVKRIAKMATDAGAKTFGGYKAVKLLTHGSKAVGVEFRQGRKKQEAFAPLVIDATGFDATLIKSASPEMGIDFFDSAHDVVIAENSLNEIDPEKAQKAVDEKLCGDTETWALVGKHGAYSTEFFHVDVKKKHAYILFGFKSDYERTTAECIRTFKKEQGYYGKKYYGGKANIRIRHSLPRLVADGFMVIGEAACMVIPVAGSGVASAMWAAHLAVEAAAKALKQGDTSTAALWPYAHAYQSGRGAALASYGATRLLTDRLTGEQVSRLLETGVLGSEELSAVANAELLKINAGFLAGKIKSIVKQPSVLPYIAKLAAYSTAAQILYQRYPKQYDPAKFETWKRYERRIFSSLEKD